MVRSFVTTVSKRQMKSQYTSLPLTQPIDAAAAAVCLCACVLVCVCARVRVCSCAHALVGGGGGDIVLYKIIFS